MAITEIIGEKTKPINNIGTSEKSKSKKLGKKGTLTLKYINFSIKFKYFIFHQ